MLRIDDEIVKKAAVGDYGSFEKIYKMSSGYVYSVAFRIIGNKEDAEEVVQDVFIKVHKNLWKFRFDSLFTTWIYRITVNLAINRYKKMKRKRSIEQHAEDPAIFDKGVTPEINKNIDEEESADKVSRILQGLKPDQRACIVLREIDGLSYEEISKVLKVKVNTVRTRLKRAREALLVKIKGREGCNAM